MSEVAPETVLWNLMRGTLTARALAIVADLGVAQALADGPRPVDDVAREVGADADTLRRILRALATDGVFAEEAPDTFRNTEVSSVLGRGDGWNDFAHLFGGVWHRAVGELEPSGEASFPRTVGTDFWSWLASRPEERASFDRAMEQNSDSRLERLAEVEWHDGETVVDVGGGSGTFLLDLLRRQRGLRGIVFDLPETNRDESAFDDRCTFVAGDFFVGVPAGDTYLLVTVLHDWPDEQAAAILRTIRASAPAHARLLVIDAVVPPGNEPHGSKWLDLLMLALFAGRERDESQWRVLLAATGWEPTRIEANLIEATCR